MIYAKISIYQAPHIHENNQVCLNQLREKSSIFSFFLFKRADTLSRKKKIVRKTHIVQVHFIVEPHNASKLPILHF